MRQAMDETNRRREKQSQYKVINGISPVSIEKDVKELIDGVQWRGSGKSRRLRGHPEPFDQIVEAIEIDLQNPTQVSRELRKLERKMNTFAANLEFEQAARVRDQIKELKEVVFLSSTN